MSATVAAATVAKVSRYEVEMWRSLYAWIARKPRGLRADDIPFGYDKAAAPIMWAFVALNFIEIPAVHFIIPWLWARIVLVMIGVWGTVWMVGAIGAIKVHPHLVGADGIRVRNGFFVDLAIPWGDVASVSSGLRGTTSTRQLQIDGQRVSVVVTGQTNITIRLTQPIPHTLKGTAAAVNEVRLFADDPAAMARACRERLAEDTGGADTRL